MRFVKLFKKKGEPTEGFTPAFARKVYNGCPIYHHWDFAFFYVTYRTEIQHDDHYEYIVYEDDSDEIIASMCIVKEFDMHVQNCMSIRVAYSENPRALIGGYRWMKELAIDTGCGWVAYSHRKGPYGFTVEYKKVQRNDTEAD